MKLITLKSQRLYKLLAIMLVLGISFGCQKEYTESENMADEGTAVLKSAQVTNLMVITKSEKLPAGFTEKLTAYGEIVSSTPEIGMVVIKPANSKIKSQIAKLTEVKAVIPDLFVSWLDPENVVEETNPPSIGDNETRFYRQWGMDAIDAPEAWNAGYTGQSARVFILDSGIDSDNPDLAPNLNLDLSKSFVEGEPDFNVRNGYDFFSHGTHVAGIIAGANNSWGVIGVAPYAEIVALKVLSEYSGSGAFSWVNQGIVYAANNGADVINMSLGTLLNRNGNYLDENDVWQQAPAAELQFLILAQQRAVNYAVKKGALVVVSAGNDEMNADGNSSWIKLPSDLENVLAVSATTPEYWYYDYTNKTIDPVFDLFASYSNYGKSLVKLAAPGGDTNAYPNPNYAWNYVYSSGPGVPGVGYSFWLSIGTSMASPHVAGVAALIIGKNGGKMSPIAVAQQLYKTADKIDGMGISPWFGYGRVNAYRAVTE